MHALRNKLTYANVMATVAVFIALGGVSYAAIKLPKNSVGAKQLKKGAVTPVKLSSGTRAKLIGPQGLQGPKGDPGAPATAIWAEVAAAGELNAGSNAVSAEKLNTGIYRVFFNRDVSKCGYLGSMAFLQGGIVLEHDASSKNAVRVETANSAGAGQDRSFHLGLLC